MRLGRTFSALLFVVFSVSVVSAYTVVMRDGRRVEIPNEFRATNSTLTYDVSSGFQITIQLNTVDIDATERANGESPGSLLRRAGSLGATIESTPQTRRPGAQRTITNAELEKFRDARVENETRRRELGLPSLEERQRETAGIEDRTIEQVRSMRAQEEAYWRSRADAFRAEMEANGTQLESWRQRSDELPWSLTFGGFPGFGPFDIGGFGVTNGRFNRFRRFSPSPFDGFLATPITPFPQFGGNTRRPVFRAPGVRINTRPAIRHGSRR